MMFSVDGLIVLTTSDYTMLCGCYESVSAEKPLITSKKGVLEDYFKDAIFVENTASKIANGIKLIRDDPLVYEKKIIILKQQISESWKNMSYELEEIISSHL